jgi:hypothetical protein
MATKKKAQSVESFPRGIVMSTSRFFPCPVCHGTGHPETDTSSICDICSGEGQLTIGSEPHLRYYFRSSSWNKVIFRFGDLRRELTKKERKRIASVEDGLREIWQLLYGADQPKEE